ncbi:hypothetical protein TSAR_010960 [Trichomalopsis sarcophagae]|uniref:Origin recognition complex subunit 2 n=1 Tax=Trichomalopsis sarcophagae TaxID=543379 RepID=A0A232FCU1_9HYME|nr:hypothetical protein TSAR_010960 [Trichomalopsis sarcophagae]
MSMPTRRSTRHQSRELNKELIAELMSPKKQKLNQSDDESSCFKHDDLKEVLDNIMMEIPTELTNEDDLDGRELYRVKDHNVRSSAMMEKAIKERKCQDDQKILLLNEPRVCLTKIKSELVNKNNIKSKKSNATELTVGEIINKNVQLDSPPQTLRRGRSRNVVKDYILKSDEYFATQSEKSVTSNNTLSKLKKKLSDETRVKTSNISNHHEKYIQDITKNLESHYSEWIHIMEEGFTILLYGLGSKRLLINNFQKQKLSDEPVLVINGFFPSLTLKEILDSIVTDLLGIELVNNTNECFDIIEKTMRTHPKDAIYLLIHNIDGGMLRSNKVQDMLSRLANIPNIHVLASVDHINAPLIWDNVKRTRYNFYWVNATTFMPYEAETSYESSLLVQKSGTLALLSLQNVFASLTKNAKDIYILLVKYQLANSGKDYVGMAFKDLYRASREGFLVSSDQALRSQLTEFVDHKLVKNKRNSDGVEYLVIPLDNALLKQFLEQQDQAL